MKHESPPILISGISDSDLKTMQIRISYPASRTKEKVIQRCFKTAAETHLDSHGTAYQCCVLVQPLHNNKVVG